MNRKFELVDMLLKCWQRVKEQLIKIWCYSGFWTDFDLWSFKDHQMMIKAKELWSQLTFPELLLYNLVYNLIPAPKRAQGCFRCKSEYVEKSAAWQRSAPSEWFLFSSSYFLVCFSFYACSSVFSKISFDINIYVSWWVNCHPPYY